MLAKIFHSPMKNIIYPRSSINSKQDKLKDIFTETQHSQTVKSQQWRENLENGKRKTTHGIQENLDSMNSWLLIKTMEARKQ